MSRFTAEKVLLFGMEDGGSGIGHLYGELYATLEVTDITSITILSSMELFYRGSLLLWTVVPVSPTTTVKYMNTKTTLIENIPTDGAQIQLTLPFMIATDIIDDVIVRFESGFAGPLDFDPEKGFPASEVQCQEEFENVIIETLKGSILLSGTFDGPTQFTNAPVLESYATAHLFFAHVRKSRPEQRFLALQVSGLTSTFLRTKTLEHDDDLGMDVLRISQLTVQVAFSSGDVPWLTALAIDEAVEYEDDILNFASTNNVGPVGRIPGTATVGKAYLQKLDEPYHGTSFDTLLVVPIRDVTIYPDSFDVTSRAAVLQFVLPVDVSEDVSEDLKFHVRLWSDDSWALPCLRPYPSSGVFQVQGRGMSPELTTYPREAISVVSAPSDGSVSVSESDGEFRTTVTVTAFLMGNAWGNTLPEEANMRIGLDNGETFHLDITVTLSSACEIYFGADAKMDKVEAIALGEEMTFESFISERSIMLRIRDAQYMTGTDGLTLTINDVGVPSDSGVSISENDITVTMIAYNNNPRLRAMVLMGDNTEKLTVLESAQPPLPSPPILTATYLSATAGTTAIGELGMKWTAFGTKLFTATFNPTGPGVCQHIASTFALAESHIQAYPVSGVAALAKENVPSCTQTATNPPQLSCSLARDTVIGDFSHIRFQILMAGSLSSPCNPFCWNIAVNMDGTGIQNVVPTVPLATLTMLAPPTLVLEHNDWLDEALRFRAKIEVPFVEQPIAPSYFTISPNVLTTDSGIKPTVETASGSCVHTGTSTTISSSVLNQRTVGVAPVTPTSYSTTTCQITFIMSHLYFSLPNTRFWVSFIDPTTGNSLFGAEIDLDSSTKLKTPDLRYTAAVHPIQRNPEVHELWDVDFVLSISNPGSLNLMAFENLIATSGIVEIGPLEGIQFSQVKQGAPNEYGYASKLIETSVTHYTILDSSDESVTVEYKLSSAKPDLPLRVRLADVIVTKQNMEFATTSLKISISPNKQSWSMHRCLPSQYTYTFVDFADSSLKPSFMLFAVGSVINGAQREAILDLIVTFPAMGHLTEDTPDRMLIAEPIYFIFDIVPGYTETEFTLEAVDGNVYELNVFTDGAYQNGKSDYCISSDDVRRCVKFMPDENGVVLDETLQLSDGGSEVDIREVRIARALKISMPEVSETLVLPESITLTVITTRGTLYFPSMINQNEPWKFHLAPVNYRRSVSFRTLTTATVPTVHTVSFSLASMTGMIWGDTDLFFRSARSDRYSWTNELPMSLRLKTSVYSGWESCLTQTSASDNWGDLGTTFLLNGCAQNSPTTGNVTSLCSSNTPSSALYLESTCGTVTGAPWPTGFNMGTGVVGVPYHPWNGDKIEFSMLTGPQASYDTTKYTFTMTTPVPVGVLYTYFNATVNYDVTFTFSLNSAITDAAYLPSKLSKLRISLSSDCATKAMMFSFENTTVSSPSNTWSWMFEEYVPTTILATPNAALPILSTSQQLTLHNFVWVSKYSDAVSSWPRTASSCFSLSVYYRDPADDLITSVLLTAPTQPNFVNPLVSESPPFIKIAPAGTAKVTVLNEYEEGGVQYYDISATLSFSITSSAPIVGLFNFAIVSMQDEFTFGYSNEPAPSLVTTQPDNIFASECSIDIEELGIVQFLCTNHPNAPAFNHLMEIKHFVLNGTKVRNTTISGEFFYLDTRSIYDGVSDAIFQSILYVNEPSTSPYASETNNRFTISVLSRRLAAQPSDPTDIFEYDVDLEIVIPALQDIGSGDPLNMRFVIEEDANLCGVFDFSLVASFPNHLTAAQVPTWVTTVDTTTGFLMGTSTGTLPAEVFMPSPFVITLSGLKWTVPPSFLASGAMMTLPASCITLYETHSSLQYVTFTPHDMNAPASQTDQVGFLITMAGNAVSYESELHGVSRGDSLTLAMEFTLNLAFYSIAALPTVIFKPEVLINVNDTMCDNLYLFDSYETPDRPDVTADYRCAPDVADTTVNDHQVKAYVAPGCGAVLTAPIVKKLYMNTRLVALFNHLPTIEFTNCLRVRVGDYLLPPLRTVAPQLGENLWYRAGVNQIVPNFSTFTPDEPNRVSVPAQLTYKFALVFWPSVAAMDFTTPVTFSIRGMSSTCTAQFNFSGASINAQIEGAFPYDTGCTHQAVNATAVYAQCGNSNPRIGVNQMLTPVGFTLSLPFVGKWTDLDNAAFFDTDCFTIEAFSSTGVKLITTNSAVKKFSVTPFLPQAYFWLQPRLFRPTTDGSITLFYDVYTVMFNDCPVSNNCTFALDITPSLSKPECLSMALVQTNGDFVPMGNGRLTAAQIALIGATSTLSTVTHPSYPNVEAVAFAFNPYAATNNIPLYRIEMSLGLRISTSVLMSAGFSVPNTCFKIHPTVPTLFQHSVEDSDKLPDYDGAGVLSGIFVASEAVLHSSVSFHNASSIAYRTRSSVLEAVFTVSVQLELMGIVNPANTVTIKDAGLRFDFSATTVTGGFTVGAATNKSHLVLVPTSALSNVRDSVITQHITLTNVIVDLSQTSDRVSATDPLVVRPSFYVLTTGDPTGSSRTTSELMLRDANTKQFYWWAGVNAKKMHNGNWRELSKVPYFTYLTLHIVNLGESIARKAEFSVTIECSFLVTSTDYELEFTPASTYMSASSEISIYNSFLDGANLIDIDASCITLAYTSSNVSTTIDTDFVPVLSANFADPGVPKLPNDGVSTEVYAIVYPSAVFSHISTPLDPSLNDARIAVTLEFLLFTFSYQNMASKTITITLLGNMANLVDSLVPSIISSNHVVTNLHPSAESLSCASVNVSGSTLTLSDCNSFGNSSETGYTYVKPQQLRVGYFVTQHSTYKAAAYDSSGEDAATIDVNGHITRALNDKIRYPFLHIDIAPLAFPFLQTKKLYSAIGSEFVADVVFGFHLMYFRPLTAYTLEVTSLPLPDDAAGVIACATCGSGVTVSSGAGKTTINVVGKTTAFDLWSDTVTINSHRPYLDKTDYDESSLLQLNMFGMMVEDGTSTSLQSSDVPATASFTFYRRAPVFNSSHEFDFAITLADISWSGGELSSAFTLHLFMYTDFGRPYFLSNDSTDECGHPSFNFNGLVAMTDLTPIYGDCDYPAQSTFTSLQSIDSCSDGIVPYFSLVFGANSFLTNAFRFSELKDDSEIKRTCFSLSDDTWDYSSTLLNNLQVGEVPNASYFTFSVELRRVDDKAEFIAEVTVIVTNALATPDPNSVELRLQSTAACFGGTTIHNDDPVQPSFPIGNCAFVSYSTILGASFTCSGTFANETVYRFAYKGLRVPATTADNLVADCLTMSAIGTSVLATGAMLNRPRVPRRAEAWLEARTDADTAGGAPDACQQFVNVRIYSYQVQVSDHNALTFALPSAAPLYFDTRCAAIIVAGQTRTVTETTVHVSFTSFTCDASVGCVLRFPVRGRTASPVFEDINMQITMDESMNFGNPTVVYAVVPISHWSPYQYDLSNALNNIAGPEQASFRTLSIEYSNATVPGPRTRALNLTFQNEWYTKLEQPSGSGENIYMLTIRLQPGLFTCSSFDVPPEFTYESSSSSCILTMSYSRASSAPSTVVWTSMILNSDIHDFPARFAVDYQLELRRGGIEANIQPTNDIVYNWYNLHSSTTTTSVSSAFRSFALSTITFTQDPALLFSSPPRHTIASCTYLNTAPPQLSCLVTWRSVGPWLQTTSSIAIHDRDTSAELALSDATMVSVATASGNGTPCTGAGSIALSTGCAEIDSGTTFTPSSMIVVFEPRAVFLSGLYPKIVLRESTLILGAADVVLPSTPLPLTLTATVFAATPSKIGARIVKLTASETIKMNIDNHGGYFLRLYIDNDDMQTFFATYDNIVQQIVSLDGCSVTCSPQDDVRLNASRHLLCESSTCVYNPSAGFEISALRMQLLPLVGHYEIRVALHFTRTDSSPVYSGTLHLAPETSETYVDSTTIVAGSALTSALPNLPLNVPHRLQVQDHHRVIVRLYPEAGMLQRLDVLDAAVLRVTMPVPQGTETSGSFIVNSFTMARVTHSVPLELAYEFSSAALALRAHICHLTKYAVFSYELSDALPNLGGGTISLIIASNHAMLPLFTVTGSILDYNDPANSFDSTVSVETRDSGEEVATLKLDNPSMPALGSLPVSFEEVHFLVTLNSSECMFIADYLLEESVAKSNGNLLQISLGDLNSASAPPLVSSFSIMVSAFPINLVGLRCSSNETHTIELSGSRHYENKRIDFPSVSSPMNGQLALDGATIVNFLGYFVQNSLALLVASQRSVVPGRPGVGAGSKPMWYGMQITLRYGVLRDMQMILSLDDAMKMTSSSALELYDQFMVPVPGTVITSPLHSGSSVMLTFHQDLPANTMFYMFMSEVKHPDYDKTAAIVQLSMDTTSWGDQRYWDETTKSSFDRADSAARVDSLNTIITTSAESLSSRGLTKLKFDFSMSYLKRDPSALTDQLDWVVSFPSVVRHSDVRKHTLALNGLFREEHLVEFSVGSTSDQISVAVQAYFDSPVFDSPNATMPLAESQQELFLSFKTPNFADDINHVVKMISLSISGIGQDVVDPYYLDMMWRDSEPVRLYLRNPGFASGILTGSGFYAFDGQVIASTAQHDKLQALSDIEDAHVWLMPLQQYDVPEGSEWAYLGAPNPLNSRGPVFTAATPQIKVGYTGYGDSRLVMIARVAYAPTSKINNNDVICFGTTSTIFLEQWTTDTFKVSSFDGDVTTLPTPVESVAEIKLCDAEFSRNYNNWAYQSSYLRQMRHVGDAMTEADENLQSCVCASVSSTLHAPGKSVTMVFGSFARTVTESKTSLVQDLLKTMTQRPMWAYGYHSSTGVFNDDVVALGMQMAPHNRMMMSLYTEYRNSAPISAFEPTDNEVNFGGLAFDYTLRYAVAYADGVLQVITNTATSFVADNSGNDPLNYTSNVFPSKSWVLGSYYMEPPREFITLCTYGCAKNAHIAFAPDAVLLLVRVESTLYSLKFRHHTAGVITEVQLPTGHSSSSSAAPQFARTYSSGRVLTPFFFNYFLRKNTPSAVPTENRAMAIVLAEPYVVRHDLTARGELMYLGQNTPFGTAGRFTASAHDIARSSFVVCGFPTVAGTDTTSHVATCAVAVNTGDSILSFTTVTVDNREGAVVTAVDLCPLSATSLDDVSCFAVAVTFLGDVNPEGENMEPIIGVAVPPARSIIYHVTASTVSGVVSLSSPRWIAVVPDRTVLEFKFTPFAHQMLVVSVDDVATDSPTTLDLFYKVDASGIYTTVSATPSQSTSYTVSDMLNGPFSSFFFSTVTREDFMFAPSRFFSSWILLSTLFTTRYASDEFSNITATNLGDDSIFVVTQLDEQIALTAGEEFSEHMTRIYVTPGTSATADIFQLSPATPLVSSVHDSQDEFAAAIGYRHPQTGGPRVITAGQMHDLGYFSKSDVIFAEYSGWPLRYVPLVITARIWPPYLPAAYEDVENKATITIVYTVPSGTPVIDAAFSYRIFQVDEIQTTDVKLISLTDDFEAEMICTPTGDNTVVSCTAQDDGSNTYNVAANQVFSVTFTTTMTSSLTHYTRQDFSYSSLSVFQTGDPVEYDHIPYGHATIRPSGTFGAVSRAAIEYPPSHANQISWFNRHPNVIGAQGICYTFAEFSYACFTRDFDGSRSALKGSVDPNVLPGSPQDPSSNTLPSVYTQHGARITLAAYEGGGVSVLRVEATQQRDNYQTPWSNEVKSSSVDIHFSEDLFRLRMRGGVPHMHTVSSA